MPLRVELYGKHAGDIHTDSRGALSFFPSNGVFQLGSKALSLSIPLVQETTRQGLPSNASKHGVFFESLLPQGESLKNLARQKQLSEKDSYGLLKALGRDVAGAIQIFDPEDPYEAPVPFTEAVSPSDIRAMLHSTYSEPLGNSHLTGMMSLGGYQNKIMLVQDGHGWQRAHNGAPTTHIIKPHSERADLAGVIYCEAYGLDLARAAGVLDYKSWIEDFDGDDALVIERFDRIESDGKLMRIHQENALQALGLSDAQKYEMMNMGTVSLKIFSKLLRSEANKKAQLDLLRTTVVNTAIGNLDAHAGNLGILHHPDGSVALSPAYDMVVNSHYLIGGGDQPLALLIGGEYKHKYVSRETLIAEGISWGIKTPQVASVVDETLGRLGDALDSVEPHPSMPEEAYENVNKYITNLLSGKPTGNARAMSSKSSRITKLPVPSSSYNKSIDGEKCGYPIKSANNAPCIILNPLHKGHHRSK